MKLTVWTSWNMEVYPDKGKPKCIFIGNTDILPRVGDYIACRDGFGSEKVSCVTIDLVGKQAEISVVSADPNNDYGPCLYLKQLKEPTP